jgi:hypothetical protein
MTKFEELCGAFGAAKSSWFQYRDKADLTPAPFPKETFARLGGTTSRHSERSEESRKSQWNMRDTGISSLHSE